MIHHTTRTTVIIALALALAWQGTLCSAQCRTPCADRTADQLWLIDARGGCLNSQDYEGENLGYELNVAGCWKRSDATIFNDPIYASIPTIFWVHGDRVSPGEARTIGLQVYDRLTCELPAAQPVRFVIFSWPSTQQYARPLPDARLKFGFTTPAGYRLGHVLSRLPEGAPVNVVGYSYGARVMTAGLHFLGGGEIGGWALANGPGHRDALRATLIAPAVGNCMIVPGQGHGLALSTTERMLVVRNSADRVLRLYPHVYVHGRGPQALGSVGLAESQLGEYAANFAQYDAACYIGKEHNWRGYFQQRCPLEQIVGNLRLE